MNCKPSTTRHFAVIGAGFSGITAAFYLSQAVAGDESVRVTLFEATERVGGVIRSIRRDGFLIEQSADNFIVNEQSPWAAQLAIDANLADQLIPTNQTFRRALVLRGNATYPVPDGFRLMAATRTWPVLTSRLLSWPAKWRLLREGSVPGDPELSEQESLQEFAIRRVGREAFQRLVQPLVGGIYTADPARLSMAAALPQFVELEKQFGSLTLGLRQNAVTQATLESAAGARYGIFRTACDGLEPFIEHIASQLPPDTIQLNSPIESVYRSRDRDQKSWIVKGQHSDQEQRFDGVILALPAHRTAAVIRNEHPQMSSELDAIPHAGVAVVCLGYRREQIRHPLDAFGLVVPEIEKRDAVAISFSSQKFPGRAPAGHVLLRVFVGGALRGDLMSLENERLIEIATSEATKMLRIEGQPILTDLMRWKSVTPQYHIGHLQRVDRIETWTEEMPGFALANNALRGIGIPQCIRSGQAAAQKVLKAAGRII